MGNSEIFSQERNDGLGLLYHYTKQFFFQLSSTIRFVLLYKHYFFSMRDLVKIQITLFEFVLKTPSIFNVKMASLSKAMLSFFFIGVCWEKKTVFILRRKLNVQKLKQVWIAWKKWSTPLKQLIQNKSLNWKILFIRRMGIKAFPEKPVDDIRKEWLKKIKVTHAHCMKSELAYILQDDTVD